MKMITAGMYLLTTMVVACGAAEPVPPGQLKELQNAKACPPGSDMDTSAKANVDCGGKAGLEITSQSGSIEAKCTTANGYAVKCVVNTNVCKYGAKTMTAEKLDCADAPAPVVPR